jgi:hypothetical protein
MIEKALPGVFIVIASLLISPICNFFTIITMIALLACVIADVLIVKNFIAGLVAFYLLM